MAKNKNKSVVAPFTPRAGMSFIKNGVRNAPRVVLKELIGRTWKAESLTGNGRYKIDIDELRATPYHKDWTLIKPEDALPEKFGEVAEDEMAGEFFGELLK